MARVWIPVERFIALLEDANVTKNSLGDVGRRRVEELYSGRQECLSLEAADRILTHLNLAYLFRIRKEDGGLLDLYTEEDPYVPSWVGRKRTQLKAIPRPRKYKTAEEAVEANRARTRRRNRSEGKRCKCGTQIVNAAQTCRSCHLAAIEAPHGSVSRYTSKLHKCRCELCTAASAAYHRERQRAMRAAYKEAQRLAA